MSSKYQASMDEDGQSVNLNNRSNLNRTLDQENHFLVDDWSF